MLYHASDVVGLNILEPHVSTHGKPYVYAINSRITALLFGTPKDDFDILIDVKDGKTIIYECYPKALEKVYAGKDCFLYMVSEEGFLSGQTGWDAEMVCPTSVKVEHEEKIYDMYKSIIEATDNGFCEINYYSDNEDYQAFLREELSERIASWNITDEMMKKDVRFELYFNKLLKL